MGFQCIRRQPVLCRLQIKFVLYKIISLKCLAVEHGEFLIRCCDFSSSFDHPTDSPDEVSSLFAS